MIVAPPNGQIDPQELTCLDCLHYDLVTTTHLAFSTYQICLIIFPATGIYGVLCFKFAVDFITWVKINLKVNQEDM